MSDAFPHDVSGFRQDWFTQAMHPGLAVATDFVTAVPASGLCPTIAVAVGQDFLSRYRRTCEGRNAH
jgi:hypothetical protein